jgi:flagellar biosynthesis/type III secretory pathway protein FliH
MPIGKRKKVKQVLAHMQAYELGFKAGQAEGRTQATEEFRKAQAMKLQDARLDALKALAQAINSAASMLDNMHGI